MTRIPWVLAGGAILAQIGWILVPDGNRAGITTVVVIGFAAAGITHAVIWCGPRWAAAFSGICLAFGLSIELVGHTTGLPFGRYTYAETLQPQIWGVPAIVPLAWLMMTYPSLLLARSLTSRWTVPLAAAGLAAWDLFLDPQMVAEGYWTWQTTQPALPGVPGIPLQNYAGWLLGSLLLMALLDRLPRVPADTDVPLLLYTWMWIGGVVANAVFLSRPAVAAAGGLGMAILGVPALRDRWRR